MKRLTVIIAEIVQAQIEEQTFYIAEDSIQNAIAWEVRLRASIEHVGHFAGHAIDHDASGRLGHTIRKLIFERTYLIHYTVDESKNVARIINFRHGSRLPKPGEP